jgi:hypothetical protein
MTAHTVGAHLALLTPWLPEAGRRWTALVVARANLSTTKG